MISVAELFHNFKLNNIDDLTTTNFKNISSPGSKGSLLLNLLNLKENYSNLIDKEIIYREKVILEGKKHAVITIIDYSNLYSMYVEDTTDYKKVIENIFHFISEFKIKCKNYLRYRKNYDALYFLAASEEVYSIFKIIDRDYLS